MKYKPAEKITCGDFCRYETLVHQLCVIRLDGWIIETVWIDHEDLFRMSKETRNAEVIGWEFGELPVITRGA